MLSHTLRYDCSLFSHLPQVVGQNGQSRTNRNTGQFANEHCSEYAYSSAEIPAVVIALDRSDDCLEDDHINPGGTRRHMWKRKRSFGPTTLRRTFLWPELGAASLTKIIIPMSVHAGSISFRPMTEGCCHLPTVSSRGSGCGCQQR